MKDEEIKLKLIKEEILKINKKYPKIDHGACGTFSYYLSELLDYLNISNEIVYFEEKSTPQGAFRCDIKFQHIMVKSGNFLIDNNGFLNSYEYAENIKTLEKDKLKTMIEEPRLWNNTFNNHKDLANDILNIKNNILKDNTIYINFIDGHLTLEIITHNISTIGSASNIIFLAGDKRFSIPNSEFFFHGAGVYFDNKKTSSDLTYLLNSIHLTEDRFANVMILNSKLTREEINLFFKGEHYKDCEYALDKGIIDEIKDFNIPYGQKYLIMNLYEKEEKEDKNKQTKINIFIKIKKFLRNFLNKQLPYFKIKMNDFNFTGIVLDNDNEFFRLISFIRDISNGKIVDYTIRSFEINVFKNIKKYDIIKSYAIEKDGKIIIDISKIYSLDTDDLSEIRYLFKNDKKNLIDDVTKHHILFHINL